MAALLTEKEAHAALHDNHKAEPEPEVTIRLPSGWTVQMYECYIEGRQKYIDKRKADKFTSTPEMLAMYHGAMALIQARHVQIDGLDKLMKAVENEGVSDMAVIGFIVRAIAVPIENSVAAPLTGWIVK